VTLVQTDGPSHRGAIVATVTGDLGVVCFVGLGPGDPNLRTEKAALRLAEADVVFHDGDGARADELVTLAKEGKRVVRAVEGDPLESPRALSEMRAIARARVPIEVVPGIGALAAVAAQDPLSWIERRPLLGKRVLVTRAREQASSTAALLRELGGEAVVVPLIEVCPPGDPGPLARALVDLRAGGYGRVAFTSANGVEHTFRALALSGHDARAFGSARIAVIGPKTAAALEERGLRADLVAGEFRGEALADQMIASMGSTESSRRVLLACAARAREALPNGLRAAGCGVDVVAAYETRPVRGEALAALANDLAVGRLDAVLFTSSSTVDSLCDALGARASDLLARPRVASIGPITTATALARGLRVDVTAAEYTLPGVVRALAESYV
jgi:uroporphyrinogen III methyltransferase/synthase